MKSNKLYSTKEASELVGLSAYLLRKGVQSGRFPVLKTDGGNLLFDVVLLRQAIEKEQLANIKNSGGLQVQK